LTLCDRDCCEHAIVFVNCLKLFARSSLLM